MGVMQKFLRAVAAPVLALALPLSATAQGLIRDAEIEQILRDYSDPLFAAAGLKPADVNMYIVQDDSLNAFVAAGQNMFLHTGLIMEARTPEELKGVIGHETGHIALGHNVTRQVAAQGSGNGRPGGGSGEDEDRPHIPWQQASHGCRDRYSPSRWR